MDVEWENLEARKYLSASLDPATKLLSVGGTGGRDVIRVIIGGLNLRVTVNGRSSNFPLRKIGSILIDAMGGNDNVDIYNNVRIPATILGGAGNDTLGGGGGNDDIDPGTGSDDISGGPGADAVDYASQSASVSVSLDGRANDGAAGAHGNVHMDIEQILGGGGDDRLTGSGAGNTIIGNAGNDTLIGAGGADLLDGGEGSDSLAGQTGNDTLRGAAGDDEFAGGPGIDLADYSDHDTLAPDPSDFVQITADDDPSDGLYHNNLEVEFDNVHSDVENIDGTNGNDIIGAFGAAAHRLNGREGDDLILGGDSGDSLDGGVGNDTLIAGAGDDLLVGGPDTIGTGQTDDDFLETDDGDDSVTGGAGDDVAIGAAGADTLDGGAGNDNLSGEIGDDSLIGGDGNDTLSGGIDDDTLEGDDGVDSLSGDDGNDVIADSGTILADSGSDDSSSITPDDDSADPNLIDTLDGGTGDDSLSGGAGASFLVGGDGNDTIIGGAGDENIDAGIGDDSVDAGDGNDFIDGDFGLDTLNGDDGNDVFDNADGQPDQIDGGDGLDLVQFEPAAVDTADNVEDVYDQPEDDGDLTVALAEPAAAPFNSEILVAAGASVWPVSVVKDPKKGLILSIAGQSDATGSPLDDEISLSQSGNTITVVENGTSYPMSATGLKGILIDAGAGDDFVALATSSGSSSIKLPATILGGKGDDVLRGGNGSDSLLGGFGNDSLVGNKGNDLLNGGQESAKSDADGRDTLAGGAGEDGALYTYRTTPLSLSLDGAANDGASGENDLIGADVEDIYGGRGADSITGNNGANLLSGGTGTDTIRGGGGIDKIIANASKDRGDFVYGDAGKDVLVMAGDKAGDRYDLGADGAFLSRDVAPGGGFLDLPL